MTNKKRLIDGHVFQRLDALAFFNFEHAVNQQKRKTVRQLLEYLVNVHHDLYSVAGVLGCWGLR